MWPFVRKGASGFSSYSTAEQVTKDIDGSGLTAIVTGANSGIGKETARVLALRGVHVVIGSRNVVAGNEAKESILKETPSAKVDVLQLDLSSLDSVRSFASEFHSLALPLNILINNAGTMANPFSLSKDKIELQFATNYLGHFLLTNLLLDNMKKTAQHSKKEGRIIDLSSEAHRFGYPEGIRFDKINDEASYSSFKAYSQSKLACLLHGNELARRLKEEGALVTANTVEPGFVATNVLRHMGWLQGVFDVIGKVVAKNVQQGAATTCYVALHPNVKGVYGEYFGNCNVSKASALGSDAELAKKLWDFSEKLIQ